MNKLNYILISFTALLFFSCNKSKPIIQLNKSYTINSSIRAIVPLENKLWFAGSNGKFGVIIDNEMTVDSIFHNEKPLHFRGIASNTKNVFMLTVENPALLYKIKNSLATDLMYVEEHEKVFYDAIAFNENGDFGVAMGDPIEDCLSIIISKDFGETWTKISCDKLPLIEEGEAAYAASNTNITIVENVVYIVSGGKKARLFKSEDFGETWQVFDTPIIQGGEMTGIFSSDFYDTENGIVMGGNWEDKQSTFQTKAITSDGGQTWKLLEGIPGYISCVQYVPKSNGKKLLATSTEGIFLSNDTGNTWAQISEKGYYTLRFENEHTFWVGANNTIASYNLNYE